MTEKPDLETRVRQFERMELPGQMKMMHMGTAYLVGDLWREVGRLRSELTKIAEFPGQISDAGWEMHGIANRALTAGKQTQ